MQPFSYSKNLYPFQSRWITINDNHIHYIDEGQGKTILFCHPPVSSSFMYRHMIKILSKNFRCIALDFPQFGMSEASADYIPSIPGQASIVEKFIEVLQLKEIFLLMQEVGGHSVFPAILKKNDLLAGLIITDTIVFPCSSYPKIHKMLTFVNGPIFNFINTNFNFLIRAMTRFGVRNRKLTPAERDTYKEMFGAKQRRRNATRMLYELVVQDDLLMQIELALKTTLNKIPALLIYGSKDPLAEMDIPQRTHDLLPQSELHWIEGEGHFPHEGCPEKMSLIISTWMNSHCRNHSLPGNDWRKDVIK